MKIGPHEIGHDKPPFLIAEVSLNHNGSIDNALAMVRMIADAGCHAAKFQTFRADQFCDPSEAMYATFKRCELPDDAWPRIKEECEKNGILFFSSPQNQSDLNILLNVGVPAIKVGSDDLTNLDMLKYCASKGLPLILSCGMADKNDIFQAFKATNPQNGNVAMLVCTSQYPCPPENCNLARITTLRHAAHPVPIGFSDHTGGYESAMIATTLGACIFEVHVQLGGIPCADEAFALTPDKLQQWVRCINVTRTAIGTGEIRPSDYELAQRDKWRRVSGQQIRGLQIPRANI